MKNHGKFSTNKGITPAWMKAQIQMSNDEAAKNPNSYPIQEQATQLELWERVPCSCDETCTCRKLGCTHHWKLKKNVRFEDFVNGFLRTFVNSSFHQSVLDALDGKETGNLNTRVKKAPGFLKALKQNWEMISARSANHNKTLFCDDWADEYFKELWTFPVGDSVYKAKQYCILYPDICVPYDDQSRRKLRKFFSVWNIDYFTLLTLLRNSFLQSIKDHHLDLPTIRKFDKPQKPVPFDATQISLPRADFDYGISYVPDERQISFVLDKCFYKPTKNHQEIQDEDSPLLPSTYNSVIVYQIFPLSGNGEKITVNRERDFRRVKWGDLKFRVTDAMISQIIMKFFVSSDEWYLLGASMTDPDENGLGYFIWKNFSSFTPRHASAIAAIMVQEKFLISRGRKPIYLKKRITQ